MIVRAKPAHKALTGASPDRLPAAISSCGAVVFACACWALTACPPKVDPPARPEPPTVVVVEARRMNIPIEDSALGDTFALEKVSIRALRSRHNRGTARRG